MDVVEIDGSYGEGGGQILRTAVSLSAVTGKGLRMYNIRANRDRQGLRMQHLTAVKALAEISNAEVEGLRLGSMEITFRPRRIKGGEYTFDIKTAGSTTLLLQALLPALIFADSRTVVDIIGGTHVPKSPTYEEVCHVFLPIVRSMGVDAHVSIKRYGFYPKGGGRITLVVNPVNSLKNINITRVYDENVKGLIIISKTLPSHIAEREKNEIIEFFGDGVTGVEITEVDTYSPGNAVILLSENRGVHSLGRVGRPAEVVAFDACTRMRDEMGSPVDRHTTDQLLVYMALAKGVSVVKTSKVTLHAKTNARVIEKFLDRRFFETENTIECR